MTNARRLILACAMALALALDALPLTALGQQGLDYPIANGRFYSQTGGGGGRGYSVLDAGTDQNGRAIRFWSEFQRLGGVTTLGYPASQRFVGEGGFVYQLFQRGALQWRPEMNGAVLSNIFQWLEAAGQDQRLKAKYGIPEPIKDDRSGGNYAVAVQTRMGWLTDPAIRQHFLSSPNRATIPTWSQEAAITLYGLPMSGPERSGPFTIQRFQRIASQLWLENVQGMPPKGSVVGILGGDLLKEAGLIPPASAETEPPGGRGAANPPVPNSTPTPVAIATPTATPVPALAYRVSRALQVHNCGTTYVRGFIYDQGGNSINGARVRTWNDYGNETISVSGCCGRESGHWDRVFHGGAVAGTWYAAVIGDGGNIISSVVTINNTANCDPSGRQETQLDFRRN